MRIDCIEDLLFVVVMRWTQGRMDGRLYTLCRPFREATRTYWSLPDSLRRGEIEGAGSPLRTHESIT